MRTAVADLDLPVAPPQLAADAMLEAMGMDKKVIDGRLRLILARSIGDAFVSDDVDAALLRQTLTAGARLCDVQPEAN